MIGTDHTDGTTEQGSETAFSDQRAEMLSDPTPGLQQLPAHGGWVRRARTIRHVFVVEQ